MLILLALILALATNCLGFFALISGNKGTQSVKIFAAFVQLIVFSITLAALISYIRI